MVAARQVAELGRRCSTPGPEVYVKLRQLSGRHFNCGFQRDRGPLAALQGGGNRAFGFSLAFSRLSPATCGFPTHSAASLSPDRWKAEESREPAGWRLQTVTMLRYGNTESRGALALPRLLPSDKRVKTLSGFSLLSFTLGCKSLCLPPTPHPRQILLKKHYPTGSPSEEIPTACAQVGLSCLCFPDPTCCCPDRDQVLNSRCVGYLQSCGTLRFLQIGFSGKFAFHFITLDGSPSLLCPNLVSPSSGKKSSASNEKQDKATSVPAPSRLLLKHLLVLKARD
ncbi:uncharacterized protein LOC115271742 isoform X1 [Suricata suricatta]|uniref:uncharacterized protein LOC115271742 isoform X1 n=1 Tax=Suricata suricatta TaxID=37032 RepID=UPI0011569EF9|nr:uncharacterized protein LOC115271742 isoform X1 [Suricata suricatta]